MSAEKERAFHAISAVVNHLGELAYHYDALLPGGGVTDPGEARELKREWQAALAGNCSRERFAERVSDARAVALPAGIPFADLEARLQPLLGMAGPLFTHGTPPADPAFTSRLRDELNALIALRDYHCLD